MSQEFFDELARPLSRSTRRPIKILGSINLETVTTYLNPPSSALSLQSAAQLFMTDFLLVHPVAVAENTSTNDALTLMKEAHVRLLLVTKSDQQGFLGIVSAADLNGPKVLAAMSTYEFTRRDEVLVKHVMIDKVHIHGLDFRQIEHSNIGDVLETIKDLSEQHIMVVESQDNTWIIRGMFSTTNIAKALHIQFDVEPQARTFFELEQVILHHHL